MRTARILLLCILGYVLLSSVTCNNGTGPDKCCFKAYPKKLNKKLFDSYYLTDHRCPIAAVILVTKKGRRICVDPSLSWTKNIMKHVDKNSF